MKRYLLLGLALILILLGYGVIRFPNALSSPSGLIGGCILLIIYGLLIGFWFPSLANQNDRILHAGYQTGILIGLIFACEMILEYILLPKDNRPLAKVSLS